MRMDKLIEEREKFYESLYVVTKVLLDNSKMNKIFFKKEKEYIEDCFKDVEYLDELNNDACNAIEYTSRMRDCAPGIWKY